MADATIMSKDEVLVRVRAILTEMFELEPSRITLDAHLVNDLDLDSIDAIDLVVKLQELTGKRVDEDLLRKVRTIGDVVNLVHAQLVERASDAA